MRLALPIVWSDRHRLHEPGGEVWVGVRTPGTEVPARADAIRAALAACDARFVEAEPHPDADVLAVHDASLLEYLRTAWDEWAKAGLPDDPGQDRVVPVRLRRTPGSRRTHPDRPRRAPGRAPATSPTTR